VFGVDQGSQETLANMLNCRLEEWPMKYLGIPISTNRLDIQAFSGIVDKMRNMLDPWKGKNLSSGGRLILTNSCLSNLPNYTMGFYLLPKSTHKNLDQIRGNFFSGKEPVMTLNTTWRKWTQSVGLKIKGVWA